MATSTMQSGLNQLPPDFQSELDLAQRKARLAEMFARQAGPQQEGKMVGRRYIAPNILDGVAGTANQFLASKFGMEADTARSQVSQRYAQAGQDSLANLLASMNGPATYGAGDQGPTMEPPDQEAVLRKGLTSPFPDTKKLAEALLKSRETRFTTVARNADPASVIAAAGDPAKVQAKPDEKWVIEEIPGVPGPAGEPRMLKIQRNTRTGETRKLDDTPNPMRITQTVKNFDDKVEGMGVEFALDNLKKSGPAAQAAQRGLASTQEALAALDQGVKTGATQVAQNWVKGIFTDLGIKDFNVEGFQSLATQLKGLVLTSTGGSLGAQISNADRDFIEAANGSVLQDPQALKRALSIKASVDMQLIERHNKLVESMQQSYPQMGPALANQRVEFRFKPGSADPMVQQAVRGASTFSAVPTGPQQNLNLGKEAAPPKPAGQKQLTPAEQLELKRLRLLLQQSRDEREASGRDVR